MWWFLRKDRIAMSKPADKPASKPKPDNLRDKKRSEGRFRERELARAGRAGKAIGAERIEIDPATGKICIILPGKGARRTTRMIS